MSATVQFVTFKSLNVQNFWTEGQSLNGVTYSFVPFIYQGSSQETGGDNSEAFLALTNTSLSLAIFDRSAINQTLTVQSRWLNNDLTINPAFARSETFVVNAVAWNEERVEVRLRSPVDAVTALFPSARLTTKLVGNIPRESSVRIA